MTSIRELALTNVAAKDLIERYETSEMTSMRYAVAGFALSLIGLVGILVIAHYGCMRIFDHKHISFAAAMGAVAGGSMALTGTLVAISYLRALPAQANFSKSLRDIDHGFRTQLSADLKESWGEKGRFRAEARHLRSLLELDRVSQDLVKPKKWICVLQIVAVALGIIGAIGCAFLLTMQHVPLTGCPSIDVVRMIGISAAAPLAFAVGSWFWIWLEHKEHTPVQDQRT